MRVLVKRKEQEHTPSYRNTVSSNWDCPSQLVRAGEGQNSAASLKPQQDLRVVEREERETCKIQKRR